MAFKIRPFSIFKIQNVCFRTVGYWPGPENQAVETKHFAFTVLHCLFTAIVLVFQLNFAFNSTENLSVMIESLVLSLTRTLVVIKLTFYLLYLKDFSALLETFDNLVTEDTKSSSRIINDSMRKADLYYTGGFLLLAGITIFFYIVAPMINFLISGVNIWDLPFMVKLPFDYHFFPAYQIVYFLISYSLFVVIMAIGGVDGTLYGSSLFIAGQFKIIEQRINDLKDSTIEDVILLPTNKNQEIKKQLIEIIEQHNRCFDLTNQVSRIYKAIVFTQFVTSSFVMGMCSLNIALAKGPDKLTFASYLLAAVIQMFAFCKNGSTLADSSAGVATAVYNFEWYKCDKEVKYLVLTILMRSQRTSELKVPFCSVSTATFVKYMQSTASFITLLQSFF